MRADIDQRVLVARPCCACSCRHEVCSSHLGGAACGGVACRCAARRARRSDCCWAAALGTTTTVSPAKLGSRAAASAGALQHMHMPAFSCCSLLNDVHLVIVDVYAQTGLHHWPAAVMYNVGWSAMHDAARCSLLPCTSAALALVALLATAISTLSLPKGASLHPACKHNCRWGTYTLCYLNPGQDGVLPRDGGLISCMRHKYDTPTYNRLTTIVTNAQQHLRGSFIMFVSRLVYKT
jgi:hypothetical protein